MVIQSFFYNFLVGTHEKLKECGYDYPDQGAYIP